MQMWRLVKQEWIGECENSEGDDDRFVPEYSLQPGCSTQEECILMRKMQGNCSKA